MLGRAISIIFAFVIQAAPSQAVCIGGFGTSCPIDDKAASVQISQALQGHKVGAFVLERHLDQVVASTNPVNTVDAARQDAQRRIRFIAGNEDCARYVQNAPFPGHAEQCQLGRALHKRGLATFDIREQAMFRSVLFVIGARFTPAGETQARAAAVQTADQRVVLSTHSAKFSRIVRSRLNDAGSEKVFEFEYELVPNVWAHVEKRMLNDGLPPVRRSAGAIFSKMSDGWRLTLMPGVR